MLGKIFGGCCLAALIFGIFTGNTASVAAAIPDSAHRAVEVTLSLLGMMCLWSGLLEAAREAGAIRRLSRWLSPLLSPFFPRAWRTGEGKEEICASVAANLFGMGNAATPFGLAAMERMQRTNPCPACADEEQITFAVLNTAPLSLLPANLIALRRAAGSADPFCVVLPIWICSVACTLLALLLTRLPVLLGRRK